MTEGLEVDPAGVQYGPAVPSHSSAATSTASTRPVTVAAAAGALR